MIPNEVAGYSRVLWLPDLSRVRGLEKAFNVLQPDQTGVELTDGFMMAPEASVSALVFDLPEADYFRADRS